MIVHVQLYVNSVHTLPQAVDVVRALETTQLLTMMPTCCCNQHSPMYCVCCAVKRRCCSDRQTRPRSQRRLRLQQARRPLRACVGAESHVRARLRDGTSRVAVGHVQAVYVDVHVHVRICHVWTVAVC